MNEPTTPLTFGIRNWQKFQHYQTGKHAGTLTWVKLYTALLDDPDFATLPDPTKAHVLGLFLLAARYRNLIPAKPKWLEGKLNATHPVDWQTILPWLEASEPAQAVLAAGGNKAIVAMTPQSSGAMALDSTGHASITTSAAPVLSDAPAIGTRIIPTRANGDAVVTAITSLFASVQSGTTTRITAEQRRQVMAGIVFAYWTKRMGKPTAMLDLLRERRLVRRLEENGDNIDELLFVVDGALRDDWTMGRDPKSPKKFDGIETIFRDRAKVEAMAQMGGYRSGDQRHPMAEKYEQILAEEMHP